MKILKKISAIMLSGIMVFAMFSLSASAEEMTKSDVVKFYHNILKETAEKNELIQVKSEFEGNYSADFSGLSGLDLKITEKVLSVFEDFDIYEDHEDYYFGVCGDYEEPSDTEIYEEFSLAWELEWGYEITDAVYADNRIVIELEDDQEYCDKKTITIELGNDNVIKKITEESYNEIETLSLIKKAPFMVKIEQADIYTFVYEEVPATSLTLSETSITLGYEDTAEITYVVGPENASFKGVSVSDAYNEDDEAVAWAYEADGKIYIEAVDEGTATIEVRTYSGDILAICEVTVEYSMWDRIVSIFDNIMFWLGFIF